jgi:hypothetical protein
MLLGLSGKIYPKEKTFEGQSASVRDCHSETPTELDPVMLEYGGHGNAL